MTYYLSGALASQNSASINQAITGGLPLSVNDYGTSIKENLAFDLSPSGEYMLKTTFMGTSTFASDPGNDYDPGMIIYQSGSSNGYEIADFIKIKGSRANDSAFYYADANNLFSPRFLSDDTIVIACDSYDPQDGGATLADGAFIVVTGSGTSWGISQIFSGSTSHSVSSTAQSRNANLGGPGVIADFAGTDDHAKMIAANNKYSSTLATRVAVHNYGGHSSGGRPQGMITIFQQSSGTWSFHSQFSQEDMSAYVQGSFSSAITVHDMTWIDENNLVVVYFADGSTDYSYMMAMTWNASTSKWEISGYSGSEMTNYTYQLTTRLSLDASTSGVQGIRFVEYDPFSERLLMGYQGDSIWMFQSQSNWLRDDLYGSSFGKGNTSEEEDHGHSGVLGFPPFGHKQHMKFAFAAGRTTIVGVQSRYGSEQSAANSGYNSLVYHESSSAGWMNYDISYANSTYQGRLRHDYFSTGSLHLAAEPTTGFGITPWIHSRQAAEYYGAKTAFTMNSTNGGDGNTFVYHEADEASTLGSNQKDNQRLLVGNFGAFPASNPALESTVTETVGTSGGTVSAGGTQSSPKVTLTFPSNALSGDTSIGIDLTKSNDPKSIGLGDAGVAGADVYSNRITLTPHGQTFASAVTVQFSLHGDGDGACPTNLEIWKRNNGSEIWYKLPNNLWSCSSGTITISTTSFSEYMAIGGNNMARTKISNVQLGKLTQSDKVLAEAINISGSLLAGEVSTVVAGDYFLIQQASGGTARPVSASVMQDFFSKSDIGASDANADQKILFASGSGGGVGFAVDDGTGLTFNASTNLLKAGALTVANTISGSIVSSAGLLSAGGNITAGGSITADDTVSGSLLVAAGSVTAGTSFVIGSADLNETDLEKLDGITNGAGAANKALVLDAGADIVSGLRNLSASGGIVAGLVSGSGVGSFASLDIDSGIVAGTSVTAGTSFIIGSADLNETDLEKLDGITNGAGAANKALVLDAGADIVSGLRNLSASGGIVAGLVSGSGVGSFASLDIDSGIAAGTSITAGTSFIIGSADLNEADLEKLDGITNGTAAASKAVVLDANKNVGTLNALTASGVLVTELAATNATIAGNLTVQGTTTTVDSEHLTVKDTIVTLGSSSSGASPGIGDRGFVFEVTGSQKAFFWDQSATEFALAQVPVGQYAHTGSGDINIDSYLDLSVGAVSGSGAGSFASLDIDGVIAAGGSVTAGTSFVIGSADLNETDLEKLDGITNGTGAASKALVLDANKNITGINSITSSFSGDGSGLTGVGAEVKLAGADDLDLQIPFTTGSASAGTFFIDSGSLTFNPNSNKLTVGGAVSGSGAGSFASLDIDGVVAVGASVTAGTSFIIGSADLNETDLEKLDGITNGVGAANKALVLDAGADVVSGLRNLSASGGIVAATVSGSGAGSFDSLDIDSAIAAGTSITAGTSFIIGSADLNETDLEKLDGITNGAGAANKALVLDAGGDIVSGLRNLSASGGVVAATVSGSGQGSFENLSLGGGTSTVSNTGVASFGGTVTAVGSFIIGSADLNEADLEKLDGITNGTAAASKAVVLDASLNATGVNALTASGLKASTALDASGTIHLHAASASVAVASDFMYFKEADGTNEVKQQTVAGFLSASTGAGLQITNGVFSVVSVTDIATSASKNSILSADLVTASLTTEPLTGSIQVYLNGLLQTPSGSVEGPGAGGIFDYQNFGDSEDGYRIEFVSAVDNDDVVQIKYIKK